MEYLLPYVLTGIGSNLYILLESLLFNFTTYIILPEKWSN